jgi:hypothetical protein
VHQTKLLCKISSYAKIQGKRLLEPILEKLLTIASGATPIRSAGRAPDKVSVFKSNKERGRRLSSIHNSIKSLPSGGRLY